MLSGRDLHYRDMIERLPAGILVVNRERILFTNPAFREITGYSSRDLGTMDPWGMVHPEERETIRRRGLDRLDGKKGPPGRYETRWVRKDGRTIWVDVWASVLDRGGDPAILVTVVDITDRKAREEELEQTRDQLQKERAYFEGLFRASPDAIVMVGQDGRILQVNKRFEDLFQYSSEEAVGERVGELIVPEELADEAASLREAVLKGETVRKETRRRRKDGSSVEVSITGYPIEVEGRIQGRYFIYRDITDRLRLEEQLRQAQKMEAVGRLASGVAHDFNNTLTTILGYATIISTSLHQKDPLQDAAGEIKKAAQRAAGITRQLLAFSRKQVIQLRVMDLNALIRDLEKMLRRLIGEDIELVTSLAPDLGRVEADPAQMDQVILNLAVNARDAMPRGGRLTIETANVELDEGYGLRHGVRVKSGPYVRLAVTDTGVGMDRDVQSKIFDPFFTTKEGGTGLGLSTVYGIVKQSGGYIWVYSEPGHGTTFKIYLPRVDKEVRPVEQGVGGSRHLRGTETVLLVEDDEMVRDLARQVLEMYGYQVLAASGGREALNLSQSHRGDIHLLLTDVVMPDMSGRDLAEQLQSVYPGLKVLYMSGYTDDIIAHHGVLEPGMEFLEKPFTPESLAGKVREVLGYPLRV